MKLTIDLQKYPNDSLSLLEKQLKKIADYDKTREPDTRMINSKISDLEKERPYDFYEQTEFLKSVLPEITDNEMKSFTPEKYKQQLQDKFGESYQQWIFLEKASLSKNDPNFFEKSELINDLYNSADSFESCSGLSWEKE